MALSPHVLAPSLAVRAELDCQAQAVLTRLANQGLEVAVLDTPSSSTLLFSNGQKGAVLKIPFTTATPLGHQVTYDWVDYLKVNTAAAGGIALQFLCAPLYVVDRVQALIGLLVFIGGAIFQDLDLMRTGLSAHQRPISRGVVNLAVQITHGLLIDLKIFARQLIQLFGLK